MNERAALYPRVSTDTQRDNYSIPSQISDCLKYAEKKGYAIVGDMYVDSKTGQDTIKKNGAIPAYVDDFSSRELNRPGLNAALEYLERVGFDVLIVHALDRLSSLEAHVALWFRDLRFGTSERIAGCSRLLQHISLGGAVLCWLSNRTSTWHP